MSYSLTINFTPPTGDGYQFVTEYRVKYWPTSSPTNVSTVFTNAFPLVLTDLNSTSYSGTIEAKCGSNYGSPRPFGPITIATSGGGGGTPTTPACPYRVVLYEEPSVTYAIGSSSNTTGCVKPGYQVKLTTEGGTLVTTSTALTVNITYTVETGDCASPTSTQTFNTNLTIGAGSSISGSYLQVSQPNQRISNVAFASGNPTTLVNGSLTCNLTYVGGGTALPTKSYYLNVMETGSGSYTYVNWYLSNGAGGMMLTQDLLPFTVRMMYSISGYGVAGGNQNTSTSILVSGLDLEANESSVSQGTSASNWYGLNSLSLSFGIYGSPYDLTSPLFVITGGGSTANNPAVYNYNGTLYYINVYVHYSLAY